MNIGIRLHDTVQGTLRERADFVKGQGFTCTHLALSKVLGPQYMQPEALTFGVAKHVNRELGGLDTAVLGCYLNLTHPDEAVYQQMLKRYIAHLRMCAWMGAAVVGTETGNPNPEYRYDPEHSHTIEALEMFIRRVRPVVEAAEKLGVIFAIEPVYTHIVSDAKRARYVLDCIGSPNLQIILDPVNLLHPDNLHRRDEVIAEAIELLGEETQVLHIKDYVLKDGRCKACPAGTGEMDYAAIAAFVNQHKPHLAITLEDTTPETAEAARLHVAALLKE